MEIIGIRQLKNEASAIIRAVREQNAEYIITYRGELVAVISPLIVEKGDRIGASFLKQIGKHD